MNNLKIAFFGSPDIAVWVLEELEQGGIVPSLVVTNPDTPQGRKLVLTPTLVAQWAAARNIPTLKPATLKDPEVLQQLQDSGCELYIVAAYGKLIPEKLLNIPKYKTLNVHPSLLPKLRGASPIRSAILNDTNPTGVSIMILTPGMDEGPLLAQEEVAIDTYAWPMRGRELDELLARKGGKLLLNVIPQWIAGAIPPIEQDATSATYCQKITKEMGQLSLDDDARTNLLKIRAFDGWPGTHFFHTKNDREIRIKVIDAELNPDGTLHITRVIPEGKKEMSYEDFVKSV